MVLEEMIRMDKEDFPAVDLKSCTFDLTGYLETPEALDDIKTPDLYKIFLKNLFLENGYKIK